MDKHRLTTFLVDCLVIRKTEFALETQIPAMQKMHAGIMDKLSAKSGISQTSRQTLVRPSEPI